MHSYYKMNSSKCIRLQLLSKSNATLPSVLTKKFTLSRAVVLWEGREDSLILLELLKYMEKTLEEQRNTMKGKLKQVLRQKLLHRWKNIFSNAIGKIFWQESD